MVNKYLAEINKDFNNDIVKSLLNQANNLKIPIITDEGIHFLIQLIKIHSSKKVLEIGSAIGYSSILMALFTDVTITTIERDEKIAKLALKNIKKANLSNRINLIIADANDVSISEDDFDLIFIDAAKASYINFFEKFAKNLKSNGLIICDNLLFKGQVNEPELIKSRNRRQLVKKIDKFNQYLINQENFDSYIYNIGDGISISIKK
ncbi:MAG: O-methyltransferase [Candidatus Izemoplasmatales bacterium]